MNLLGQLQKIEKVDETVAMPTARNYSPEEDKDEEEKRREEQQYTKQSRNAKLAHPKSTSTSKGTLHTVNMLPAGPNGEVYHSPHMQSRLLQNFNQARQTLKKAKPPTLIHPIQNLEMTPQMDTFSQVEPSII